MGGVGGVAGLKYSGNLINDLIFPGFNVENSFLDEKEEAVLALKQIAEFTG